MSDDRISPAELSSNDFRTIGHELVDRIADFLASLAGRPVAPDTSPRAIRERLGGDGVPVHGADPSTIMREAAELLFERSTFNGHPRFFGYITSSASPIGALSDLLAASVNANCGAWALSPAATEVERQVVRWVAELIGFPCDASAGGILVSGGNMANIVCLIAALRAQAGWDVRAHGVGGGAGQRLAVYASSEVHTWLQKGADLCGLGIDSVRSVPVDGSRAMNVDALLRQISEDRERGLQPAVVVGTAGSVSTGAIDPLPELASICARNGLWFHVDGAYGAPAAVLEHAPAALAAMALADSVAVDPHKWLYSPIEAGCSLVRDKERLHDAFVFHPPYYKFDGDDADPPTNFHEWGPQNTRGFRALKVWATIRQVGRDGYRQMIGDDIALAREMFDLARGEPELEALTNSLSITTFRYVPAELRDRRHEPDVAAVLNQLNTELLTKLQADGRVYLSNAVIDGVFALRACIVNFRTRASDVRAVVDEALAGGRALWRGTASVGEGVDGRRGRDG
jgi:glutamate/tyrosine decarboxylase-like PLP-dependent enzyme